MSAADAPIWKDGRFRADAWTRRDADDASALPSGSAIIVPLSALLADPERFLAHDGPRGVEVQPGEDVRALAPHLDRIALIALAFPAFSDGRSYSAARLLRERLGFEGELRAIGDVLADQIPLMRRCGVTSFAVSHAPTRAALEAGRLAEVRRHYQPIPTAPGEAPAGTRPWLRQSAG